MLRSSPNGPPPGVAAMDADSDAEGFDAGPLLQVLDLAGGELGYEAGSSSEEETVPVAGAPESGRESGLFCDELMKWNPFGSSDNELAQEARMLRLLQSLNREPCNLDGLLKIRCILRDLSNELRDVADLGLPALPQQIRMSGIPQKPAAKKLVKLRSLLDQETLLHTLSKPCGNRHECLKPFADLPTAVMWWRRAFYTLDKQHRLNAFVRMYREAMMPFRESILEHGIRLSGFTMSYKFLGLKVCRKAFVQLAGISDGGLQGCS